jgi:hypothetical protein
LIKFNSEVRGISSSTTNHGPKIEDVSGASAAGIAIIGVGPRGLSVLERVCANVGAGLARRAIRVHLVDPYLLLGGQVWRTDQSRHLLMNTVASQITMFVDDTVDCAGPVVPGPSLHEWAQQVARTGQFAELPDHVRVEARSLGPNTYPTRAFYGQYLTWVLRHLIETAPPAVTIVQHPHRAVDLDDDTMGLQTVTLANGEQITGLHSVVLSLGHTDMRLTSSERRMARHAELDSCLYFGPKSPAEMDLSAVRADEPVVLRGLGLNFFDHMALLTVGRGGSFERTPDGQFRYRPSGREPLLIAGSRRGVPHHARGENQKGPFGRHIPLFLTGERLEHLRRQARVTAPLNFRTDIWPWVDLEVRSVYYSTLVTNRDGTGAGERFRTAFSLLAERAEQTAAEDELLAKYGIDAASRWDWRKVTRPHEDRRFRDASDFRSWLLAYLRTDVREAKLGNVYGPLKAALDALRDLRNEIRLVVDHGQLSGDSYWTDLRGWFNPMNAFLSIGPPAQRIEEMIALIEAGVLEVIGPDMVVEPRDDGRGFLAHSPLVSGAEYRARVLIEARLPEPDVRRTTDLLTISLLDKGSCSSYRIPINRGGHYETGGLAITQRPYRLVDKAGNPHSRRFALGVPAESVLWATAAGVRPGVNSVILGDADAVARQIILLTGVPVAV